MRVDLRFTLACCVLVLAACAAVLVIDGNGEPGLRALIRITARMSFVLFDLSVLSGTPRWVWPSPFTRVLARQRDSLFVAFVFCHLCHAVTILTLGTIVPPHKAGLDIGAIPGAVIYVLLVAAAAARLAGKRSVTLQNAATLGAWIAFTAGFASRIREGQLYVWWTAAVVLSFLAPFVVRRFFPPPLHPA